MSTTKKIEMTDKEKLAGLVAEHGVEYVVNAIERYVFWRKQWREREAARREAKRMKAKNGKRAAAKKATVKTK